MSAWEQQYTDVKTYFKLPTSVNSMSQCEHFEDYGMCCLRQWGQLPFPAARTNLRVAADHSLHHQSGRSGYPCPFGAGDLQPVPGDAVPDELPICLELELDSMNLTDCQGCLINTEASSPWGITVDCSDFAEVLCPGTPAQELSRRLTAEEASGATDTATATATAFDVAKNNAFLREAGVEVLGAVYRGGAGRSL